MTKPQLFINTDLRNADGTISENWISADINPDVNITVKDKIKDSKDVGKVFAAYTNQFKLPASKTNNRIFKRFASNNIVDGFDPRRKYDALIKLNGVDFKKGYVKLNSVSVENNSPVSYSVQFFGEITSLKDTIGSTELKDLRHLGKFSYENNLQNVKIGFEKGFNVKIWSGVQETSSIEIISAATTGGDFNVTLDGLTYTIQLSANATIDETKNEITSYINENVSGFSSYTTFDNFVYIDANEVGDKSDMSINALSSGVSATATTNIQGQPEGTNPSSPYIVEDSEGDFKYTLLSHTRGFEYDDDGFHRILSLEERDANHTVISADRLNFADLKPSMRIELIFDAIEAQFPTIRFNKEWMFGGVIGKKQVTEITFNSGSTSSGIITISLNGNSHDINISIGNESSVAQQVSSFVGALLGYTSAVTGTGSNVVFIESQERREEQLTTLSDTDNTGTSFTVSTTVNGFASSSTEDASTLKNLYMWLHNRKGYMGYESTTGSIERRTIIRTLNENGNGTEDGEWNHALGSTDLRPLINDTEGSLIGINEPNNFRTTILGVISSDNIVGDGDITLEVTVRVLGYAGTDKKHIKTESLQSGDDASLSFTICTPNYYNGKQFVVETKIIADSSIISYTPSLVITKTRIEQDGIFEVNRVIQTSTYAINNTVSSISNLDYVNPQKLMPKMKVMDFLSDIFKTYNLVAFEERLDDNSYLINIKSLDDYIDSGVQYDITNYVDISSSTVSRISPFREIEYNYTKPKTFLAINQSEITGDDFGNVKFNVNNFQEQGNETTNSFLFDGGTYKVQPKFEKMMFERLVDVDSKELTNIQWGWFVADNKSDNFPNPTIGKPLIHYINRRQLSASEQIEWSEGTNFTNDYYNAPSNVDDIEENTTHFNSEFDEWNRDINVNSIFENFHSRYIQGIYSKFSRRLEVKSYLPPAIFSRLSLSDTIVINNVSYIIDSMDVNINKALTKLNLLRVVGEFTTVYEGDIDDGTEKGLSFRIVTTSSNEDVELPYLSNGTYSGLVDWGDGQTSANAYSERTHTYATAGEYIINITGDTREMDFNGIDKTAYTELISFGDDSSLNELSLIDFENGLDMSNISDKPKFRAFSSIESLLEDNNGAVNQIEDWDTSNVINMKRAFYSCSFNQPIGGWDVSNVVSMEKMFRSAALFNQPLSNWDVGRVSNMSEMFAFSTFFNQEISGWDVSNVTNMYRMFRQTPFNKTLLNWNVSKVENMREMFSFNNSFNKNISKWNVSNVTDMNGMFKSASSFNQSLSTWDVSNVSNFQNMFSGASSFNQNISGWNITGATGLDSMFRNASSFNQPIGSWDVSGISSIVSMFNGASDFNQSLSGWVTSGFSSLISVFSDASSFNGDIVGWDTSNVTRLFETFKNATSFNQDISGWNTSDVYDMEGTFDGATSFNQDISGWDFSSINTMEDFMSNMTYNTSYYNNLLAALDASGRNNVILGMGSSNYTSAAATNRANLISRGWTITDGGQI